MVNSAIAHHRTTELHQRALNSSMQKDIAEPHNRLRRLQNIHICIHTHTVPIPNAHVEPPQRLATATYQLVAFAAWGTVIIVLAIGRAVDDIINVRDL